MPNSERNAVIRRLWQAGHSAGEIGEQLGITRNAVIGVVNRAGIQRGTAAASYLPWTDDREARLIELFNAGMTAPQIAERLGGTSRSAVHHRLEKLGYAFAERPGQRGSNPPRPKPQLIVCGNGAILEKPPGQASPLPTIGNSVWNPIPGSTPVKLAERAPFTCRWPVDLSQDQNPSGEPHFCGQVAPTDRYCAAHHKASVAPVQPSDLNKPSRLARALRRQIAA